MLDLAAVWVLVEHAIHQKLAERGINHDLHQCGGHSSSGQRQSTEGGGQQMAVAIGSRCNGRQLQSVVAMAVDNIDKEGRVYSLWLLAYPCLV